MHKHLQQFRQYWNTMYAEFPVQTWSLLQHEQCLEKLLHAYGEPQRAYHQCQHIVECLALFDLVKDVLHDPFLVQLAIFFHDVVYQPRSHCNEQDSVVWMRQQLGTVLPEEQLTQVEKWILATQQHAKTNIHDLAYLLDIDLAILGSQHVRFAEYEQQIRQEYDWVEVEQYRQKRAEVFKKFYNTTPLYQTEYFVIHFEPQAKINLRQALQFCV